MRRLDSEPQKFNYSIHDWITRTTRKPK